jgi:hypothetical protein
LRAEKVIISESNSGSIQKILDNTITGDTVFFKKGTYRIDSTINIRTNIVVLGESTEETVFYHGPGGNFSWIMKVSKVNSIRLSRFTIRGKSPERSSGIFIAHGNKSFRIDHCSFERCSKRAIEINRNSYGVIDHNIFIDNWPTAIVVYGNGNECWGDSLVLGSKDAVFVEDNVFMQNDVNNKNLAHHIASNNGSKYVFRHNTVKDGNLASHAVDAHGLKYGWERGSRSYEIYKNIFFAQHRWAGINIRGGDGVIFDNVFFGEFVSPIHLMHEGKLGDGNCIYPCDDQIRELYIWSNSYNEAIVDVRIRHNDLIAINRDVFNFYKPGYKPFIYPHPLVK